MEFNLFNLIWGQSLNFYFEEVLWIMSNLLQEMCLMMSHCVPRNRTDQNSNMASDRNGLQYMHTFPFPQNLKHIPFQGQGGRWPPTFSEFTKQEFSVWKFSKNFISSCSASFKILTWALILVLKFSLKYIEYNIFFLISFKKI